jgi:chemotaxis protein methyltransferase WspC
MGRIETLLRETIGFDAASVGAHVLGAAVRRCMNAAGLGDIDADVDAYAAMLSDPRELERLIAAVAVPESSFFRDPGSFEYLGRFAASEWRGGALCVLSVPCASGEEPYSIAMTLLDAGVRFSIDAVDIRAGAVDAARAGVFRPAAFRNATAHDALARHFDGFTLRPRVRELVRFHTGNLLDRALLAGRTFDVVFCKNLLIYFTAEARARALAQLERFLAPGGRLFVGASEAAWMQSNGAFAPVAPATAMAFAPEASHVV